jgi:hypothetical protein
MKILFFLLLGLPFFASAQSEISVKAQTDTDKIRIGEQVKLRLTATLPGKDVNVVFPQLPDSFSHWEVVNRTTLDTVNEGGTKLLRQWVVLTSFDSGHWDIPAFKFDLQNVNGGTDSAFSDAIGIDVNTVEVDTTKAFKPIKTVRAVAWNILDYWIPFTAGIVVLALIIGLIIYFRSRKKKVPPPPAPPAITPYEAAVKALQQIKQEKIWQTDVKLYYTRLTDVLRTYFEEQFHIPALEQTTEELLQHIKPVTILNQQREKLRALLSLADLAKFAKLTPTAEEHEAAMQQTQDILEWTKPAAKKEEDVTPPAKA